MRAASNRIYAERSFQAALNGINYGDVTGHVQEEESQPVELSQEDQEAIKKHLEWKQKDILSRMRRGDG